MNPASPSRLLRFIPLLALICAANFGCSTTSAAMPQASQTAQPSDQKPADAQALPPNTISYTPEKVEPVSAIAHHFLSKSSLMLAAELEDQIRETNHLAPKQLYVKKGQTLLIPTIEPQPVVEHSVAMAKDEEVRAIYLTGAEAASRS